MAEQRERLLPELSPGLEKLDAQEKWNSGLFEKKDGIALRASPPLDVDLWFDPLDRSGHYCSDELYQALAAAGFGRAFLPLRCKLVDLNYTNSH